MIILKKLKNGQHKSTQTDGECEHYKGIQTRSGRISRCEICSYGREVQRCVIKRRAIILQALQEVALGPEPKKKKMIQSQDKDDILPSISSMSLNETGLVLISCFRGEIFSICGKFSNSSSKNDVFILDLGKKSWTKKRISNSGYNFQSHPFQNWLITVGGRPTPAEVDLGTKIMEDVEEIYFQNSKKKDGIRLKAKSKRPRDSSSLLVFKNRIYTIGGVNGQVSGVIEVFDPKSPEEHQHWKVLKAKLSVPRYGLVAVSTETEIYAIGGRGQQGSRMTTVEIRRTFSNIWEAGPDLLIPRAYASAVYSKEHNAIFVFGGVSGRNRTAEKLDLATKTWSLVDDKNLPIFKTYLSVNFHPCN